MSRDAGATAFSATPSLGALARVARALSRARSRSELIDRAVRQLAELGLSAVILEVEGDHAHVLSAELPPAVAEVVDELLGRPLAEVIVPVDGLELLRTPVRRRTAIATEVSSAQSRALLQRVTAAGGQVGGALPAVRAAAAPVEAGDELLGILGAWGPRATAEALPLLDLVASQLAPAWRLLAEPLPDAAPAVPSPPSADLRGDLEQVLRPGRLRAALQPVVRLADRVVLAYEALCRFAPSGSLHTPEDLFAAAAACGAGGRADEVTVAAAVAAGRYAAPATLFINCTMRHLLDHDEPGQHFAALAVAAGLDASDIVLEINERDPVADVARLRRVAGDLRAAGFRLAIDDAGAGHASMLVIAEVRPEFIKVDRSLIHAIHADAARRALVVSLLSFGAHIHARVIAEGIEDERELETLIGLGVQWGQGWLLGMPVLVAPAPQVQQAVTVAPSWFAERETASFPSVVDATAPVAAHTRQRTLRSRRRGESLPHVLSHAAQALQAEHDPRRILEVIAELLERVVPVDDITIYAADVASHRFVPMHATGPEATLVMRHSFPLDLGITGWVFALGTPQYIPNAVAHPAAGSVPGTPYDDESLLMIPLIAGDRRLGVLNCRRYGLDRFSADDLEAATLFGHTAAAAWRNAQLYSELAERAMTDPLTGLLNSRWLRDAGDREVAQSARAGRALAVVLVDLDHFKEVNDSSGHAVGDVVLQRVARELRTVVRSGDAAVRLGGEEFVLILRDADEAGALRVAESVHAVLRKVRVPAGCALSGVTASLGVAVFPGHGHSLTQLVRAADLAMYASKRGGRDRTTVAGAVRPEVAFSALQGTAMP